MHLLLGVGDSDDALRALEATVERAQAVGDDLTVVVYGDRSVADVESLLAEFAPDAEVPVRTVEGDPGGQLVDLAQRERFDRIVLPGGQRSPLGKISLDRVAEFVLLNAPTTVTLVR